MQEDSFHLVDNRPAKATKFGQRRFQQNRFHQQRREREAAREAREKREAGGKQQQQKKNPWQQNWREQQRVSGVRVCVGVWGVACGLSVESKAAANPAAGAEAAAAAAGASVAAELAPAAAGAAEQERG
jgi:translation initiation factor 3 subunit D